MSYFLSILELGLRTQSFLSLSNPNCPKLHFRSQTPNFTVLGSFFSLLDSIKQVLIFKMWIIFCYSYEDLTTERSKKNPSKILILVPCYNQWQITWEKLLLGQFLVSTTFPPLNNVVKQWANLASSCYGFTCSKHFAGEEGGFLNTLFNSHNTLSLIAWNLQKKKD